MLQNSLLLAWFYLYRRFSEIRTLKQLSRRPAKACPLSIPEEDHPSLGQRIRDSHEVPLMPVAGVEGVLDLFPDVSLLLVQHQLLRIVSSVALICNEIHSFRRLGLTSILYARPFLSAPII